MAGAWWREIAEEAGAGRVVLISGNVWADVSLRSLMATHAKGGHPVTLAVAQGCSMVLAFDEALRSVAHFRPALFDTRVEAGTMVVEANALKAVGRPARCLRGCSPRLWRTEKR